METVVVLVVPGIGELVQETLSFCSKLSANRTLIEVVVKNKP